MDFNSYKTIGLLGYIIVVNEEIHSSQIQMLNDVLIKYEIVDDDDIIKNIDNEINEMNLTNDINTFLNDIDLESRVLFVRKYFLFESSKMIASRFNMSENLINIKLFRIRKKLKSYLLKRGYKLEKI